MKTTLCAALAAATLLAGTTAGFAQNVLPGTPPSGKGNYASGYRGEIERRSGDLPFVFGAPPAIVDEDDEPVVTGTIIDRPDYLPGTPPSGKGNYAGGYRGEAYRRLGQ